MLAKGTLSKIFSIYLDQTYYKVEVTRAFKAFVGKHVSAAAAMDMIGRENEGYFNEWFLYDYVGADGRTALERFVHANPLKLSPPELALYEQLLATNRYGMFEVLEVRPLTGLVLEDLQTSVVYNVAECSATLDAAPGAALFGRVAEVGDHWELVGANSYSIPAVDATLRQEMKRSVERLTPRDALHLLKTTGHAS